MDPRNASNHGVTVAKDAGTSVSLLPQSPLAYRQLAVAAAADQKKKVGKKHPGKAILAGESSG